MADIVDSDYVLAVYGDAVEDTDRLDALISAASDLVQEYCGQTWTVATAPAAVKAVVANVVIDTLNATGGKGSLRAEQIGDYRWEGQPGVRRGLDLAPYEDQLAPHRIRVYSVVTGTPVDNPTYGAWWEDDETSEGDT